MTRIVAISGSLRRGSFNTALLRDAARIAPRDVEIEIASLAGIPLFDADREEAEGPPQPVTELKERLADADGLLIATPEYNAGIPGGVKNAVDWLSRPASDIPRVFGDLPVALVGVGGRGGTRFAQAAWLPVLRYLGTRPWSGASLYGAGAWQLFADGELVDDKTRELLARVVEGFSTHCAELPRRRG